MHITCFTSITHNAYTHLNKLVANTQTIVKSQICNMVYKFEERKEKILFVWVFFVFPCFSSNLQQVNQWHCFCETGGVFHPGITVAQAELPTAKV